MCSITKKPINIEFTGTPEAGKTTQIKIITKKLREEGYKVHFIQESAELVPKSFKKNSADAHRWMNFKLFEDMLYANSINPDIVLIDRGYIDRQIWQKIFLADGKITLTEYSTFQLYLNEFIQTPDILFVFSISPDLSIKRRGGEGRVTTKKFVNRYNDLVNSFLLNYPNKYYSVDAKLSIDEVSHILLDNIHNILPN